MLVKELQSETPINHLVNYSNSNILNIPYEIALHIFSFFSQLQNFGQIGRVCKRLYAIQAKPIFWKCVAQRFHICFMNFSNDQLNNDKQQVIFYQQQIQENFRLRKLVEHYLHHLQYGDLGTESISLSSPHKFKYLHSFSDDLERIFQNLQILFPQATEEHGNYLLAQYREAIKNPLFLAKSKNEFGLRYSASDFCQFFCHEDELHLPKETPLCIYGLNLKYYTNSKNMDDLLEFLEDLALFSGKSLEIKNEKDLKGWYVFKNRSVVCQFDQPIVLKASAESMTCQLNRLFISMIDYEIYTFNLQPQTPIAFLNFPPELIEKFCYMPSNFYEYFLEFLNINAPDGYEVCVLSSSKPTARIRKVNNQTDLIIKSTDGLAIILKKKE